MTALDLAAKYGHLKVVKCLIKHKADINPKDTRNSDKTPLMHAAINGHSLVVKYLLDQGADPARTTRLKFKAPTRKY